MSLKKQVKFSRFQEYHRYSWVAPVDGFQTKKERRNAIIDKQKELEVIIS